MNPMNESQGRAGRASGARTNGGHKPLPAWNDIDWRSATRTVRNLRQRLYRAAEANDGRTVRSLQKLLLRSISNVLMSVRRVTQVNAGKETPGVDRVVVKTPAARRELVRHLLTVKTWKAQPVR